ncbi:MAG: aldose 1-epimerase family protein, partial [Thermoguttaceae bacterium]|nr:aldose 1-epimerase family protein [Thermoguttaceae bacterium]
MEKTRTIVDTYHDVYTESLDLQEIYSTPTGAIPFRVSKRRLHGGVQEGVDVVEIDAGKFSFVVLLSRGMNIWKARCGDVELKWDSPVRGPVHPRFVPIFAPNGCGWLEGFDEWVARCGLESNGAPEFDENGVLRYPLHGRISNLPARRVQVTVDPETGMIRLTGEVLETSVFGRRFKLTVSYTTWAGSSTLLVEDSITNLASVDDEFELLYHINTGYPFVTPGAKFVAPFRRMCPRDENAVAELDAWDAFREPIPGCAETCYLFDLAAEENGDTSVALLNAERNRGLSLSFNKNDFPYFTLWKTQRPNGDIYVSGIEPSVNFPNRRSFEK